MRRYGLRDDQWDRIMNLLLGGSGTVEVTASDNRLFVEAVNHIFSIIHTLGRMWFRSARQSLFERPPTPDRQALTDYGRNDPDDAISRENCQDQQW